MTVLALIIAVLPTFVNAEPPSYQPEASALSEKLAKEGSTDKIGSGRSRILNIPTGTPVKFEEVVAEQTTDDMTRSCELVYDSSGTARPMCLLLRVNKDLPTEGRAEAYYFRLDPKGRLEKIILSVIKLDPAGAGIKGSGKFEEKKPTPALLKMLRKELDFWLKGKYRKTPPASPAAKKQ